MELTGGIKEEKTGKGNGEREGGGASVATTIRCDAMKPWIEILRKVL